jgi:hypothetical protein
MAIFDKPSSSKTGILDSSSSSKVSSKGIAVSNSEDKNRVIQYKTEHIAVLQKTWVTQEVEFIIAFDDLTKEGYRLMAIDEEKSGGNFIWWIHSGS